MKNLFKYTVIQFKVLLRVPISIFFTVIFPQMMLFVFVLMNGNERLHDSIYFVDVYLPVAMMLSMMSAGIISFAVVVAGNLRQQIWQFYELKGFKFSELVFAEIFVNITICFISSLLLILSAYFWFQARIPNIMNFSLFCVVWLVICFSIFLIGASIGVLSRDENVAQAGSTVIMFILMILSGVMVQISQFPGWLQNIVGYLPTTQANNILLKYWTNTDVAVNWWVIIIWDIVLIALIISRSNIKKFERRLLLCTKRNQCKLNMFLI